VADVLELVPFLFPVLVFLLLIAQCIVGIVPQASLLRIASSLLSIVQQIYSIRSGFN